MPLPVTEKLPAAHTPLPPLLAQPVKQYRPAGHGVHGATEVLEKVPAAQPVTQLVSALEPGAEDNPEGHLLQLDEFAGDQ